MSASDSAMLQGLTTRIEKLEGQVAELMEKVLGKELHGELDGPEVNHTEERGKRAGGRVGRRERADAAPDSER